LGGGGVREDWVETRWSEVLIIKNGKHYLDVLDSKGKYPIYGSSGIINYASQYLCNENSIIVGRKGTIDKPIFVKEKFWNIDTAFGIEPNRKILESKFLFYFATNFNFMKLNQATAIPSLTKTNLLKIEMSIPPLLEQKAIVAKIEQLFSELDNAVANLKTAKAKLKIYRQAVLKNAFDGDYKFSNIGETCDVFVGATPSRKMNHYWGGEICWVSSGEVKFNVISDTKEKITEEGLKNTSTEIHPPQTILLAMIGEGKTRGQCAILNIHAAHNQNTAALRAKKDILNFKFLYYFLVFTYEDTRRVGSGNNQKALNKTRVSSLQIPLPLVEKQSQIVQEIESRLSVCDKIEETIETTLAKSEALRQSILKKAFEGKLLSEQELQNIKNHSEYESAQMLLERIKKERSK